MIIYKLITTIKIINKFLDKTRVLNLKSERHAESLR